MSLRRIFNLVTGLPREAAVVQAVEPAAAWSDGEHILALVAEQQRETNLLLLKAHFELRGAPPEPLHIPRPGEPPPEPPPAVTMQDIRRMLTGIDELGAPREDVSDG